MAPEHSHSEHVSRLTPIQEGMLFHNLRFPRSGVDIEQMVATLHEPLNPAALRRAWQTLGHRYEVFRSGFEWTRSDQPRRIVRSRATLPWFEEDCRDLPADAWDRKWNDWLAEDRRRGFELDTAPLSRCALFQRGVRDWRFVWTFHHILADGSSFSLLIREGFELYAAFRDGTPAPPSKPDRYSEFLAWLDAHEHQSVSLASTFWRSTLQGFTAHTPIPPRSTTPDLSADASLHERSSRLSAEHTRALRSFASANAVTLATLLEGAWSLLLARQSGEDDVVFGVTRACRRSTIQFADETVGSFINTLPVRVKIDWDEPLAGWLQRLRQRSIDLREFEHTALTDVQRHSDIQAGGPLFETLVVFTPRLIGAALKEQGAEWADRDIVFHEQTNLPVTLFAYGEPELVLKLAYDVDRVSDSMAVRWLGELQTILEAFPADSSRPLADIPILSAEESGLLLETWNATGRPSDDDVCIHELIDRQVARTPDAVAIVHREQSIRYEKLSLRAGRIARRLNALGVGPDCIVGIHASRSIDMVAGMLGVLKAGGAYLPLDPRYPSDRLSWMIQDSGARVLVTQAALAGTLPRTSAHVVTFEDIESSESADMESPAVTGAAAPSNLAYVIYTSGSSGRPKGVMIEHRQVVNFFSGMDDRLGVTAPGVWLAVTSISFDISVLELLWTLARGFKVVVQDEIDQLPAGESRSPFADRNMEFSLFYFAADAGTAMDNKYRLLLDGARFADQHGFAAVWTPERHFHPFGGIYPNPAVTGAAVAAITSRVAIRAGSVVLPLHDPIRVAEEWAVVDNLSRGRVGLSFASGWHVNDFALKPENYNERRSLMTAGIETVRRLWRGEAIDARNGNGEPIKVRVFPAPVQTDPPIWITTAGNIDTFRMAGRSGANLLTNLLGQKIEELGEKIAAYRDARRAAGHQGDGHVSLMLHTFVGSDPDRVRQVVRKPFIDYLKTSTELVKQARWEFPAFAKPGRQIGPVDNSDLTAEEIAAMMDHAFERYFHTSGLFGTPDTCLQMVDRLKGIGVDEIACLVDFGVAADEVLDSLKYLNELKDRSAPKPAPADYSVAAQIARHQVTHLQCTPSFARTIVAGESGRSALGRLETLLLGGEALPPALAADVQTMFTGKLLNMYGPTETTIWSTVADVPEGFQRISIGRPIANTQVYIADSRQKLLPIGAAGELLIGGDGVARGYWNDPDLTAVKFIPNRFTPEGRRRLYRTGDLARYHEDGDLEFLGRLDHQVKVSGHRIELGEVEAVLSRHPAVRQAVVVVRADGDSEPRLVAYVVPQATSHEDASHGVERWQAVWNEAYGRHGQAADSDPTFDTSGWTSSYTGEPMPAADMREWVDNTVARVRDLNPKRVLEIGCGTGLLLFRLAPLCEHYAAVDFSAAAISRLEREVAARRLDTVELHVADAASIAAHAAPASFDVVIINSVAQYFPDVHYLVRVLEQAVAATAPGGAVFIGDVRSLAHLEAFHTSVELARAPDAMIRAELRERIRQRSSRDGELVIAPEFFEALRRHLPAITGVSVLLKRGRSLNEMTRYRYDVILEVGGAADVPVEALEAAPAALETIVHTLASRPKAIAFRGMVNSRVAADVHAVALLADDDCPGTAGEIRAKLGSARPGIDPEDLIEAGAPYHVHPGWSRTGAPDAFDAAFVSDAGLGAALVAPRSEDARPWSTYVHQATHDPGALAETWREHLRDQLPSFMVPSAFVTMPALPMTPNGKVDRKALPEPDRKRFETAAPYVPPASDLERIIGDTWQQLLKLDRIGVHDNFFDIGANSLLMVQAHLRLRDALGRPVSLVDLFRFPTVSALARALEGTGDESAALGEGQKRAQARLDARNRRQKNRLVADAR